MRNLLPLFLFLLFACVAQTELKSDTTNEDCREALLRDRQAQTDFSYSSLDRIGRAYFDFNLDQTCELYRFRANPKLLCPAWEQGQYSTCLKERLEEALQKQQASATYPALLNAYLASTLAKFIPAKSSQPPWQAMDFFLYLLENEKRLVVPSDLWQAQSEAEAKTLAKISTQEASEREKLARRAREYLEKTFTKWRAEPELSPGDQATIAENWRRFQRFNGN